MSTSTLAIKERNVNYEQDVESQNFKHLTTLSIEVEQWITPRSTKS